MELRPHGKWPFWLLVGVLSLVFIYLIRGILLPFVLGMFIAYFLHPVVDRMEKAGTPRSIGTLMILASFFLTILLLSVLIVPIIAWAAFRPDRRPSRLCRRVSSRNMRRRLSRWLGGLPVATTDRHQIRRGQFFRRHGQAGGRIRRRHFSLRHGICPYTLVDFDHAGRGVLPAARLGRHGRPH